MPDYFLALNKQYGLAINDQQAETHAQAVIKAWYLTLPVEKRELLLSNIPEYLRPKQQLFFNRIKEVGRIDQHSVMFERLTMELQKTDTAEVSAVIGGLVKSLKIVLDHHQKFELSRLLDKKLLEIFVGV